jgi:hypothetical protein
MAILRAQLLKGLSGLKVKATIATSRDLFIFTHLLKDIILVIPLKLYSDCSYRISYRNYATLFCSERLSLSYRHWFSRCVMAPKRKQPAATKVMRWIEKGEGLRNAASNSYDLMYDYL